jgi:DNA primase
VSAATDRVLERVQARATGPASWSAKCPAHDDHSPSLSISEGDDGRALVKCHAGCATGDVCAALGLSESDLFVPTERLTTERRIVATYDYRTADGAELFQVVRYFPKDFRQRRLEGGVWVWNLKGVTPVLYRLDELLPAIDRGRTVYVVEGEKDADALTRAGVTATCAPMGAGKWRKVPDAGQILAQAGEVVVVADDDPPGYRHARDVVRSITDAGGPAPIVVRAAHGKDAADHLAAGHDVDAFVPFDLEGQLGHDAPVDPERPSDP